MVNFESMKGFSHPIQRFILVMIVLAGCGGKPSKDRGVVYSGNTAMRITHTVRDFSEWLKVYKELADTTALISMYVNPEDPNLVTVYELTTSHEEARKKFDADLMRRKMKRAGVSSEPVITYFEIKYRRNAPSKKIYRVEITHDVEDYDTWKKVFDAGEQRRINAGMELRGIFTDADNPNMVGVVLATDDVEKLHEMMASEEFQKIKKEAGIASKEMVIVLKVPDIK